MTNNIKTGKEKMLRIWITIIRHDGSHGLNRRDELLSHEHRKASVIFFLFFLGYKSI